MCAKQILSIPEFFFSWETNTSSLKKKIITLTFMLLVHVWSLCPLLYLIVVHQTLVDLLILLMTGQL